MKALKLLATLILSAACAGAAFAQSSANYAPPLRLAQNRVLVRQTPPAPPTQVQQHQRRFVMPPGGAVYPRGTPPRYSPQAGAGRTDRMTAEDRRVLRRQINEANQGIYRSQRNRMPPTRP